MDDLSKQDPKLQVSVAQPHERDAALKIVCGGYVPDLPQPESFSNLFVAKRKSQLRVEQIVAAGWLQGLTKDIAALWPPKSSSGGLGNRSHPQAEQAVADALREACEQSHYQLIRALIDVESSPTVTKHLNHTELNEFTQIHSLYAPVNATTDSPSTTAPTISARLTFHRVDPADDWQPFCDLIEQTYVATLDCPELTRYTTARSLLESYARQRPEDSRFWFWISSASQKRVGALLIHDEPEDEQTELTYLGLIPEVRGNGLGAEIVDFAKDLSAAHQRRRLMLSVDVRNEPAVRLYHQAGFSAYAAYRLFARHAKNVEN